MSTRVDEALRVLTGLLGSVEWNDAPLDRLDIIDDGVVLPTPWPITANAVAALAAVGLAASRFHELRSGEKRRVKISTRHAGLAMASSSYLQVDGKAAKFRDPFTGFYEAANERWVFLHGNFPHLRDGVLRLLGVSDVESVAAEVKQRSAFALEAEGIARGLCIAAVRTRDEWEGEAQHAAVKSLPLLGLSTLADSPLRHMDAGELPLSGVRMLDLSRVIAGPMGGRTIAEFGGDVLLVSGPGLPSIESLVIDTGFGKRSAELDLDSSEDRQRLEALICNADIFLDAYRPGSLSTRGYSSDALVKLNPGLVRVDLDAFSRLGPWAGRRGYDSLVQATMGMCWDGETPPENLPCQPIDYLSGYLAAFGAQLSLIRQVEGGGARNVELSLARTAQWMWDTYDALGEQQQRPESRMSFADAGPYLADYATEFGDITALKSPLQDAGWRWPNPPVRLGSNRPVWR